MFHILSRSAAYSAYSAISAFVSSLNIGHGLNPELREGWILKSESPCKKNKRRNKLHCAHTSKGTTGQTKQNIRSIHISVECNSHEKNVACIIHIWPLLHFNGWPFQCFLVVPGGRFCTFYLHIFHLVQIDIHTSHYTTTNN